MDARRITGVLAFLLTLTGAGSVRGDDLPASGTLGGASGYAPEVPVSAFARPASWLDMSRLRVSTMISVGTGWSGRTDALQVTSLSYQVAAPLAMRLSIGNALSASNVPGGRGMFLEGFSLAYHPHPAFQINIDYRDIRSPLQYSNGFGYPTYPGFGTIGR